MQQEDVWLDHLTHLCLMCKKLPKSAFNARHSFSRSPCFFKKHCVLKLNDRYIVRQKCLKKWIGSALIGTKRYNFQPSTLTESATIHSITDGQTDRWKDRQTDRQYYVNNWDQSIG